MRYHPEVKKHIHAHRDKQQQTLMDIRQMILQSLPNVEETFSYAMPTYRNKQNIIHFRGYANHIGIYPGPVGIDFLKTLNSQFTLTKGTWKVSWEQPFPFVHLQNLLDFLKDHYHL